MNSGLDLCNSKGKERASMHLLDHCRSQESNKLQIATSLTIRQQGVDHPVPGDQVLAIKGRRNDLDLEVSLRILGTCG